MFHQNVTLGPGTGTFSQHTFEILIMLLGAALLGLWLGWILWNRYKQEAEKLRLDLVGLNAATEAQRAELTDLKTKLAGLDTEHQNLSAQVVSLSRNNNYQRDKITELEDNLATVQARNRQLETELGLSYEPDATDTYETVALEEDTDGETDTNIETPVALADIPLEINLPDAEIIEETEAVSDMADGASETDSGETIVATLAAEEELPALEVVTVTPDADAAIEDMNAPRKPPVMPEASFIVGAADAKDDLTVIEGIGPKIQELLYQYGIRTYRQLATTDVTNVKEILRKAGPQLAMHDPGTWTAQALLAANDQWENLKAYQDYLSAGKAPKSKG
jgi:predicted flap endonuclease-1-like 5' DNA nuclease